MILAYAVLTVVVMGVLVALLDGWNDHVMKKGK